MRQLSRRGALALAALAPTAQAQAAPWLVATEYPANAIPGEGVAHFAAALSARGIAAEAQAAAPGYRSADAFTALSAGRYAVADSFAGALGATDALFLLSSLPFLTGSPADAARLRDLARPHYAAIAARQGAALLWSTPWPPSGLWSRTPIATPDALRGLRLRTYDSTGTEVMRAAGAAAEALSFAQVDARLADGTLDAVLSSGDGGAGRQLWRWLPHFTEISYAWPLSLAFIDVARLAANRDAVTAAATETEALQWRAIEGRLAANRQVMAANGVTVHVPTDALRAALRAAAAVSVEAWKARAGEAGRAVLTAYAA